MTRSTHLSNTKISKLLIEFSIPAIVGMLVNALYNVADNLYRKWGWLFSIAG